jgi:acetyl esterase/lipase
VLSKTLCTLILASMTLSPLTSLAADSWETINLWDGPAPGSEKFNQAENAEVRGQPGQVDRWVTGVSQPTLTIIPARAEVASGTALIICPGGGYGGLSWDKEGIDVARRYADLGITGFVLKYRHGGGPHQHPVPLSDAQRAVRIVRSRAAEWNLKPDQIGVMGFSAGGHLASSVGTHFDAGQPDAQNPIDRASCRPDYLVLIYPVITMDSAITNNGTKLNLLGKNPTSEMVQLMSGERQVTESTPPTFLIHATDDTTVPVANSLRFYEALVAHKVPAELHVFAVGGHGFGMRREDQPVREWPHLLDNWLRSRQLIQ